MYVATAGTWVALLPATVWPFVCDPTNLNRFLSHIRQVRSQGDGHWEWQLSGLLGIPILWHTQATTWDSERLVWESTRGPLKSKGWILVQPQNGGSCITVHLEYQPLGGALEEMFAQLFKDPQKILEDDLEKLRKILAPQPTSGGE